MNARNLFNRFARGLPEVLAWLSQFPVFGFVVFAPINILAIIFVVLAILFLVLFKETCAEELIRIGGLVLQLFGLATVVLKLAAAKGLFQLPRKSFRQWLKRFPPFPPTVTFLVWSLQTSKWSLVPRA
jgi:hypothetical protein